MVENIAWGTGALGTVRAIMRAWLDSEGHRANLLIPSATTASASERALSRVRRVPRSGCDDHRMVVLGLRTLFNSRPEVDVVAWAHDAEEALAACREHRPQVAVLDVALEGSAMDGIEICHRLRRELPEVEVVFSTGMEELGLAERAFASGAQAVVSKGDRAGDLLKAVLLPSLRLLARGMERKQIAEVRRKLGAKTSAQAVAIGLINSLFGYPESG